MSRIDVIGQNGNDGEHYDELDPVVLAYYAWMAQQKESVPTNLDLWKEAYQQGHSDGFEVGYQKAGELFDRW